MNQIKCPKCGTVFTIDESQYDNIVRQVRDQEFQKDLAERIELAKKEQQSALELARQKAQSNLEHELAAKEAQLNQLKATALQRETKLNAEHQQQIAELKSKLWPSIS